MGLGRLFGGGSSKPRATPATQAKKAEAPKTQAKASKHKQDDVAELRAQFNEVMDRFWKQKLAFEPEESTMNGIHDHDTRWSAYTVEAAEAHRRDCKAALREVDRLFPPGEKSRLALLPEDERLTVLLLREELRTRIEWVDLRLFLMPINGLESPQMILSLTVPKMKFGSKADFQIYLKRLEALPEAMNNLCELLRKGAEEGVTPPRVSLESTPAQIEAMIASERTVFHSPLDKHLDEACPGEDKLREDIEAAIETLVLPTLKELAVFLREEYVPKLGEDLCMAERIPEIGEKVYAHLLRRHTTTRLSPEEVHEIGVGEVERIEAAMQDIAKSEGFESVEAYQAHLDEVCVKETEQELLDHYGAVAMRIMPELPKLFGKLPRTTFGIRPVPEFMAQHAPAAYYEQPPEDLSQPGWFSLNTSFLPTRKTYIAEGLVLHEAVPGHHLQLALVAENGDLPPLRKFTMYTAYTEGWGLYSEFLGTELGMYKTPESLYGRLVIEMMRACRLVVDTGMNALGWSKEKAMEYMLEHHAGTKEDIDSETTRYVGIPGQACAYKMGELKLRELRERATAELKPEGKWDVREFHDVVLACGSVPLTVLSDIVDQWVDEVKARA